MPKLVRAFAGALIAVVIDVLINLIAASAEKQAFIVQLISTQGIWILIALILCGLVAGVMLERPNKSSSSRPTSLQNPNGITISGSKLFWSTTNLKGKGIQMNNVTSVASKNEADTTK